MIWLRKLALLLLPWVRRQREQSLGEELRTYLDLAAEEAKSSGLSAEEAAFAAHRDLGNVSLAKEESRSEWTFPFVEELSQDIRYALRTFKRTPLFATVAVATLALGIGAATSIFSLVDSIVLEPLAYRDSGQLLYVQEIVPALQNIYPTMPVNFKHFTYWQEHATSFDGICALRKSAYPVTGGAEPEQVDAVDASASIFDVLGTRMQRGRGFLPGEDQASRNDVVVIADSLRQRYFGGASDVLGRSMILEGKPFTVVGVLPANFAFPKNREMGSLAGLGKRTEIFLPTQYVIPEWDGDYDYIVIARLKHGVNASHGLSELNVLTRQLSKEHQLESQPRPIVQPLQEVVAGSVRTGLLVLLVAVLLLLLIVCANLANLQMARASAREREFSIRTALGAGKRRLLQQLFTESALLSVVGGGLGIVLAYVAVRAFVITKAASIPRLDEVHISGMVLAFALIATMGCAILFGLIPAYRTAGPKFKATRQSLRLREVLVGSEVGLSTVLVVLAGLLVVSLSNLVHIDKGFHEERAVALDVNFPDKKTSSRFFEQALPIMRSLPGVQSAGLIAGLPLTGETHVNGIELAGSNADWIDPASSLRIMINVRFVSDGYFETLEIPLINGRTFTEQDRNRKVTVISRRFAAMVWPGQDPIGKKFKTGSGVDEVQVVGVVSDTYNGRLDAPPTLIAYVPYSIRMPEYASLVVRGANATALMRELQQAVRRLDSNLPVAGVRTMSELVDESLSQRRFQVWLAGAFGIAALLLALIGIYGVVAYNAEQRRGELGVRLALGARASQIVSLMLKRGLTPVLVGVACGLAASLALASFVRSLVFGISPSDPELLVAIAFILVATASAACLIPASRVARMNAAAILRHE